MTEDVGLGACLVDGLDELPLRSCRDKVIAGEELVAAAEATPVVRRLRAVLPPGCRHAPANVALARMAAAGPLHRLHPLAGGVRGVLIAELGAALDAGLFDFDIKAPSPPLVPGAEFALLAEHPLGAWGDVTSTAVSGYPAEAVSAVPSWLDDAMLIVPFLLLQLLTRRLDAVALTPLAASLRQEAEALAPAGAPTPSLRRMEARLAGVVALLAELGTVTWQGGDGRLGRAEITGLGLLGWVATRALLEGEMPPAFEQAAFEHGYLKADGGYIHVDDLPIPAPSPN